MKRILLFILSGICCLAISAQDIKKKYSSMTGTDGSVYFIHPFKGFKSSTIKSDMEYDITYPTFRDSVTYNFTFYNQQASPVDSVALITTDKSLTLPASMIFIDVHKKDSWKHRVTVQIPYSFITELYRQATPYTLKIYSKENEYLFEVKDKDWKNQSAIVSKIFQLIDLNKNK